MKIVSMGGGTGLSTLLRGLKRYLRGDWTGDVLDMILSSAAGQSPSLLTDLSAVVAVSDDGGSSGRLRRQFQVLSPGDIRNCIVALSEDEALLSRLFQFRFASGLGLKGHNFGNLFLTALSGVTGDFHEAVKVSCEVLAIRGRIFPSTMSNATLEAVMENGRIVSGETRISHSRNRVKRIRLVPAGCKPLPETLAAIREADAITLGPGSLYTSLIPNLLVDGMTRELARSRAAKIYICNIMTQPGETNSLTAADHLRAINRHCGRPLFDYVLVNTAPISPAARKRYQKQSAQPVVIDRAELEQLGAEVVEGDFVAEEQPGPLTSASDGARASRIRHQSDRLAKAVLEIAVQHRRRARGRKEPRSHRRADRPSPRRSPLQSLRNMEELFPGG